MKSVADDLCPCCRQRWQAGRSKEDADRVLAALPIAPNSVRRRLLNRLLRDFGKWVPREWLIDAAYHDRPDGGPEEAARSVGVTVTVLRKILAPHGLCIEGKSWHGSRLIWAEQQLFGPDRERAA